MPVLMAHPFRLPSGQHVRHFVRASFLQALASALKATFASCRHDRPVHSERVAVSVARANETQLNWSTRQLRLQAFGLAVARSAAIVASASRRTAASPRATRRC